MRTELLCQNFSHDRLARIVTDKADHKAGEEMSARQTAAGGDGNGDGFVRGFQ